MPVADELLGYHLERAVVLRRELGAPEATTASSAARASRSLRAAGRRAVLRDDPASVRLLERALALTPQADRAPVLVELTDAFDGVGDLEGCVTAAAAALKLAAAAGDRRTVARARAVELRVTIGPLEGREPTSFRWCRRQPIVDELEALGDDEGMAAVLLLLGHITMNRFEQASGLPGARAGGRRAQRRPEDCRVRRRFPWAAHGVRPGARCRRDRALPRAASSGLRQPDVSAQVLRFEAALHAMQGRIDEARALHTEADHIIDDLGNPWASAGAVWGQWMLEMLAGAPERAEAAARASLELYEEMGATNQGSTAAALLACALAEQGRYDEALRYADLAAAWAAPDDVASQVGQLAARAQRLRGARRPGTRRGCRARSGSTLPAIR